MKISHFKSILVISSLLILIFINACDPPVVFTQPQPEGGKNLKHFPSKLKGYYLNTEDSSILTISNYLIKLEYFYRTSIPKHEVDTSKDLIFNDNSLIERSTGLKHQAIFNNDTIWVLVHYTDTLFKITSDGILRKFKGHFCLNNPVKGGWQVEILTYSKGGKLNWKTITAPKEIEELERITEVETITDADSNIVQYNINPKRKELSQIIGTSGSIGTSASYIKVKLK